MKILSLEVEGFRSLRSQTWCPGDINVLIGPNASGKSNLLRALELLNISAQGGLGRFIQREGGMEPQVWDGRAERIRLRAKMTPLPPYDDETQDALTYEVVLGRLGKSSAYRIDKEVLGNFCKVETGETSEPFRLLDRDPRHAVVFSIDSQRFEARPESVSEAETLLSAAAGPFSANRFVSDFQGELSKWRIHQDFQTHREARIRAPQVARTDKELDPDGQNLVSVLHHLYETKPDFESEIVAAMRAAFGEDFTALKFPPAADGRVQMRIQWRSLTQQQSAAEMSDGTLRFLFLLAVLANPSPPPLIALDEPETGLHPSMFPIVADYARDAATRAQVILTTHSPEFLDAFGDHPPTTTVVDRQDGETTLRVVSDEELSYWLKQYTLGELFRSKELEAMS